MSRFTTIYSVIATAAVAFLLGRELAPVPGLDASPGAVDLLLPQGRRPPGSDDRKTTEPKGTGTTAEPTILQLDGGGGMTQSSDGILAVTGSYGVGTAVLYVIDTRSRQLAVYEARGGSQNGRRLFLVGARRIDLDLRLEGYNDKSEFPFDKLKKEFEKAGLSVAGPRGPTPRDPGDEGTIDK